MPAVDDPRLKPNMPSKKKTRFAPYEPTEASKKSKEEDKEVIKTQIKEAEEEAKRLTASLIKKETVEVTPSEDKDAQTLKQGDSKVLFVPGRVKSQKLPPKAPLKPGPVPSGSY